MNRSQAFYCLLTAVAIAAVASAEEPGDGPSLVDKSSFHLFNPTPAKYLRQLTRDGPGKTESPATVDAGHFQLEMDAVSYTSDKASSGGVTRRLEAWAIARMNFKVGLLNQLDAQLMLETYNLVFLREGKSRVTQSGFGDVTARVKYNVWGNDEGRTALAMMPYLKLPTSQDHLGNHSFEGGLIMPLEVELPLHLYLGLTTRFDTVRDQDGGGYHTEFANSIALARTLFGRLGGYVEFFSGVSTEPGASWEGTFDAGLIYELTPNLQLDAGVNIGITRAAEDCNPFLGLTWRF